jgi:hypothetical protein
LTVRKAHFDKPSNEEIDWNSNSLDRHKAVIGSAEGISEDEVAITKMKTDKVHMTHLE